MFIHSVDVISFFFSVHLQEDRYFFDIMEVVRRIEQEEEDEKEDRANLEQAMKISRLKSSECNVCYEELPDKFYHCESCNNGICMVCEQNAWKSVVERNVGTNFFNRRTGRPGEEFLQHVCPMCKAHIPLSKRRKEFFWEMREATRTEELNHNEVWIVEARHYVNAK
jgi:hypothetical protein